MWEVSASVYGDTHQTQVNLDDLDSHAQALYQVGRQLEVLGNAWSCAVLQIGSLASRAVWCTSGNSPEFYNVNRSIIQHSTMNVQSLISACNTQARRTHDLAQRCTNIAQLLWRARGVYSDAEYRTLAFIGRAIQSTVTISPVGSVLGGIISAGTSLAYGALKEGGYNGAYAVSGTAWAHEGVVAAVAQGIGQIPTFPLVTGLMHSNESNRAASRLAPLAQGVAWSLQSDNLRVTQLTPSKVASEKVHSLSAALEHLDTLSDPTYSGLPHSTLSIQRYRNDSGGNSWLVTIPGTQSETDSPLGWAQNVQLMSDNDNQRMQAASARFVLSAMEQAGIQPQDKVALVGHSQGGIVAATLASQSNVAYRIEHIVTAGSPIANHPIPSSTWVTSVEVEDELVSALDGAPNPTRQSWITVRGKVQPKSVTTATVSKYMAATVLNSGDNKELPHGMNYQRATWQSAQDLGAPDTEEHDEHFCKTISGELQESLYFQGRMVP